MSGHQPMSLERKNEIINEATKAYRGQFQELERAIGMLMLGDLFGWRVLYLVHERRVLRKYERILGINVREQFPERGEYSKRSVGLKVADTARNFWKLVKGEVSRDGMNKIE